MARKIKEDSDTKNLIKRGSVWYVKRMVDGKLVVQTTGETVLGKARLERNRILNPMNLRDERDRAAAVLAQIQTVDQQLAKIADDVPSLGILATWAAYTNAPNRPDSGQRTMAMYESQFNRFTEWMQKHHPQIKELRRVTEEIAFQFASELGRTLTPNSYNKYLVLFRRVWKVLFKTARLTVNPWTELDNKLLTTHSRRELTIDELTRVCASVTGEMRLLFAFGIYCGLRLGDAVQLNWGNVDLIRSVVMTVPSKTARRANGKVLKIPLHNSLLAMLAETPDEDRNGYVMPALAALYQHDDTALVKRINKVFKDCGIVTKSKVKGRAKMGTDVGFHSMRHSFVSLSANAGANLAAVQAIIGHSSPAMTRHYLHADQKNVQNAVALLPNVTGTGTPDNQSDAARLNLGTVLGQLDALKDGDLDAVIQKAQEIVKNRKTAK